MEKLQFYSTKAQFVREIRQLHHKGNGDPEDHLVIAWASEIYDFIRNTRRFKE